MHLTVRFIGAADEARTEAIKRAMEVPFPIAPFELRFAGAGAFPGAGTPRVIWVGVEAGTERLREIERETTRRLQSVGIPPEDRPYSPHLTLARVRDAAGLRTRALVEGLERVPAGATRCEAITLYESRLSPQEPAYLPLLRTPLRPQGS